MRKFMNAVLRTLEKLRGTKVFVVTTHSLDLREIRWFKTKLVSSGLVLGLLTVGGLLLVNFLFSDLLGIGYNKANVLANENRLLKEEIQSLSDKMGAAQGALDRLADRGDELRLMVDLSKIDGDTRKAASGGSVAPRTNAVLSGNAAELLASTQSLIEKLGREIRLQQNSYEEISKQVEVNKQFFSHLPAIKPMAGAYAINGFGMRIHPVLRVLRPHEGIDIMNEVGTNIYASADGVVEFSGRTAGGYGIVIELQHGYGYSTLYAHLDRVLVKPGQKVRRGELIAKCGRSGLVSGPHLHYEIRHNGRKMNPVDYFFDDIEAARYRSALAALQQQHG
jgi:murein DD-endopeptidase MepM/ murein hydrolase activator NlpD